VSRRLITSVTDDCFLVIIGDFLDAKANPHRHRWAAQLLAQL
jgi:hypothetical protein